MGIEKWEMKKTGSYPSVQRVELWGEYWGVRQLEPGSHCTPARILGGSRKALPD